MPSRAGFIMLILLLALQSSENWELARDKNGVQIYTRRPSGGSIKEFMGVTRIRTTLSALVAVYQDVETYADWMPNTSEARLLESHGDTAHVHYIVNPAPWPVADRDAIYRFRYGQTNSLKTVTIHMENIPDFIPEHPGRVRIPEARGVYYFTPMTDNQVKVIFQFYAEPGGNIPAWMVNMRIVDGPYKTLLRLKERVQLAKYHGRTYSFITE